MNSMAMIPPVRTSMLPFATAVSVHCQGFGFHNNLEVCDGRLGQDARILDVRVSAVPPLKTFTLTVVAHALTNDLVDIVYGIVPLEGRHNDGAAARLADPPESLAPKRRHAIIPQEHGVTPFASFYVALYCFPRFRVMRQIRDDKVFLIGKCSCRPCLCAHVRRHHNVFEEDGRGNHL